MPYEQDVISRLDKLSVLRLAVSFLQIKAHFQACLYRSSYIANFPFAFAHSYPFNPSNPGSIPYGGIPTAIHHISGQSLVDPNEHDFETMALKALGGFILILNENGDIYYASQNIETYLGFHQSDILHQSLFEMIHSEDREDIKQQLAWNYNVPIHVTCLQDILTPGGMPYLERSVNARFRCLLDNTCGFLRIDVRGKLMSLHGLPHSYVLNRTDIHSSGNIVLGLIAVCSPFVPPNVVDQSVDDPILKTKHSLDFAIVSMDSRMKTLLELDTENLPCSFYNLVHIDDAICIAEAHKEATKNGASGILIYRLISLRSRLIYWIQSSCRMFYKNGKPETIGLTHRVLTEVEGMMLLEKRASLKAKLLSFDDSLLQSPRSLQCTAALPSASSGAAASLALYMIGSNKSSNHSTLQQQHHHVNLPALPSRPLQSTAPINQDSEASLLRMRQKKQMTRGRKRKKHVNGDGQHQVVMPATQHAITSTTTVNDQKQMQDERQQQILAAATAAAYVGAGQISRIPQAQNFTITSTRHNTPVTGTSAIQGLLQFPQDFNSFSGLTAYFSTDNTGSSLRNDSTYQWSTAKNYWPSPSELYYQNYATNNAGYGSTSAFTSTFCSPQMDQSSLMPSGCHVEYPTLVSANDLNTSGTYAPTPAQLLFSSSEIPSTIPVHATNTFLKPVALFEPVDNLTLSGNSQSKGFVSTFSNYSTQTASESGFGFNYSNNTSGSTGFNLISDVTNTLLG